MYIHGSVWMPEVVCARPMLMRLEPRGGAWRNHSKIMLSSLSSTSLHLIAPSCQY